MTNSHTTRGSASKSTQLIVSVVSLVLILFAGFFVSNQIEKAVIKRSRQMLTSVSDKYGVRLTFDKADLELDRLVLRDVRIGDDLRVSRVSFEMGGGASQDELRQRIRDLASKATLILDHVREFHRFLPLDLVVRFDGLEFSRDGRIESGGSAKMRFAKSGTEGLRFDVTLTLDNAVVEHSYFSRSSPVGPVHAQVSVRGEAEAGEIRVTEGLLELNPEGKDRVALQVAGLWSEKGESELLLTLPPTACQSFAKLDATSLTPTIAPYEISGVAALGMRVSKAMQAPFELKLEDYRFSCQMKTRPGHQQIDMSRLTKSRGMITAFQKRSQFERQGSLSEYVHSESIPRMIKDVFLNSEDISFFHHQGFDPESLVSALESNLNDDRRILGGSTITMQLAKNIYLSGERTLGRKLEELMLAKYLEDHLSKEKILELYLNVAEFGPGIYGIGAASRLLFAKPVDHLSLTEASYLAALLPAPVRRYQYFCQGHVSENMRRLVAEKIDRLYQRHRIDAESHARSRAEVITFAGRSNSVRPRYCDPAERS